MQSMKKNEQSFISKELMPWLKNRLNINAAIEAKFVTIKEARYNYKSDKSLQKEITNLKIAGRRLCYKLPDGALSGTPFDIFCLSEAYGAFAFKFQEEPKKFFIINVGRLCAEIESGSRSLTSSRAEEISDYVILANKKSPTMT